MLSTVVFSAVPALLAQDSRTPGSDAINIFANNVIATAKADGTDDPSGTLDYNGCPGNDGTKDDEDKSDNDARQICGLKNKGLEKGAGTGKKAGDADYNNTQILGSQSTETDENGNSKDIDSEYGASSEKPDDDKSIFETFMMVVTRIINPSYYLNRDTPKSDANNNTDENSPDFVFKWLPNSQCSSLDKESSYTNDNCDVPGIVTQAFQDLSYSIIPTGIQNAEKKSAVVPFGIGIPTELIPASSDGKADVPVNGQRGSNKYTALELFGYNFVWTNYNGEWDKIDILPADRLAADINIFSTIWSSVQMGVGSATNNAHQAVTDAWNNGNVIALVGAIISWIPRSITNTGYYFINGIMNGYENGVFDKSSWKRDDFYRDTDYSVTVMSDIDQAGVYRSLIANIGLQKADENAEKANVDTDAILKEAGLKQGEEGTIGKIDFASPEVDFETDCSKAEESNSSLDIDCSKKMEDLSADAKNAIYNEAFKRWQDENKDRLQWAKDNLGIDASTYYNADGNNTASGTDTDTDEPSQGDSSNTTPLDSFWKLFSQDYAKKANTWATNKLNEETKKKQNWFVSFINNILSSDEDIAKAVKEKVSNNALFFICIDENGKPDQLKSGDEIKSTGNKTLDAAVNAGFPYPGQAAFNIDDNGNATPNKCADGKMRQPIVGALNGSQGTTAQINAHRDTRRTAYSGISITDLLPNPAAALTSTMLSFSQKIAMGINFMVNLSFTPLLEQLGIKDVVVGVVKTLKDSLYMTCLQMMIIIGVMVAFIKGLRGRSYDAIKQVLLVVISGLLGMVILYNPEATFKVIDEYPTNIEKAVAALILQSASPNQDICSATGSPSQKLDSDGYTDFNGKSIFDPNSIIRGLECNIWSAYVFEPWSLGQFGVGHAQLYAQGYAPTDGKATYGTMKVDDKTAKMVGNADVDMGGGTTVHNWALYQVAHMVGGTTTQDDVNQTLLQTDHSLYKLVDIQAGPDNAKGKDTSHWTWWTGRGNRFGIAALALVNSIGGIMSIGMFAFAKIEATFMMSVMFALAPVMLLVGVVPGGGRLKMQNWAFKILGYIFKRFVLMALLCIQLIVLIQAANSNSEDATASMMFMAAISVLFAMYGKEIIKAFTAPIDQRAGAFNDIDDRIKSQMKNSRLMIGLNGAKNGMIRGAGAFVGSVAAGGFRTQNTSRAMLDRFTEKKRNAVVQDYSNKMQDINKSRQDAMFAYNNGTITLNEYNKRIKNISDNERNVTFAYQNSLKEIDGYQDRFKNDFKFRAQIMGDDSLRVENEGIAQMKHAAGKAVSSISNANYAVGNVPIIRDSIRAVQDDRKTQIQNAYNNIFINNPQVGRELLGTGDSGYDDKNIQALQSMLSDADLVDLRQTAHQLGIATTANVELTQEQFDEYNSNLRYDRLGNPILVIDDKSRAQFRGNVIGQVKKQDDISRASNIKTAFSMDEYDEIASDTKASNVDRLKDTFMRRDVNDINKVKAMNAANKFMFKNVGEREQFKQIMLQHFDNHNDREHIEKLLSNAPVGIDLNNPNSLRSKYSMNNNNAVMEAISRKLQVELKEIDSDASLTKAEKDAMKEKAKKDAGLDRKRYATTDDFVVSQAQTVASCMLAMNVDDLQANYKDLFDIKDGQMIPKEGLTKDETEYIRRRIREVNGLRRDLIDMGQFTDMNNDMFALVRDKSGLSVKFDENGTAIKNTDPDVKYDYRMNEREVSKNVSEMLKVSKDLRDLTGEDILDRKARVKLGYGEGNVYQVVGDDGEAVNIITGKKPGIINPYVDKSADDVDTEKIVKNAEAATKLSQEKKKYEAGSAVDKFLKSDVINSYKASESIVNNAAGGTSSDTTSSRDDDQNKDKQNKSSKKQTSNSSPFDNPNANSPFSKPDVKPSPFESNAGKTVKEEHKPTEKQQGNAPAQPRVKVNPKAAAAIADAITDNNPEGRMLRAKMGEVMTKEEKMAFMRPAGYSPVDKIHYQQAIIRTVVERQLQAGDKTIEALNNQNYGQSTITQASKHVQQVSRAIFEQNKQQHPALKPFQGKSNANNDKEGGNK